MAASPPVPITLAELFDAARQFGIEAEKLYANEHLERLREHEELKLSIVRTEDLL